MHEFMVVENGRTPTGVLRWKNGLTGTVLQQLWRTVEGVKSAEWRDIPTDEVMKDSHEPH